MTTKRILVVDEDPDLGRSIREALDGSDYEIIEAKSEADALGLLSDPVQLVVVHRILPDAALDEIVRAARGQHYAGVVMICAEKSPELAQNYLRLGVDEVLPKPLEAETVRALASRYLERDVLAEETPDKPRVLVVDDDEIVLLAVSDILEETAVVTTTQSAEEAIRLIKEQPFEMLLTDVMMPGMPGTHLIRAAKNARPSIVAIVMTGYATKEVAVRSLQEGAHDFLEKPLSPDIVLTAVSRTWKLQRFELENRRLLGELRRVNAELSEQIAERGRLEEHLTQAKKLTAIGELAGGVAHDFNNMLMIIMGYNEQILDQTTPGSPVHCNAEQIETAAKRSSEVVRHLLAFSRKQMLQPEVLHLNTLIKSTRVLLEQLFKDKSEVCLELDDRVASVEVDPVQFEQVILNLAINARDAMKDGGSFTIRSEVSLPGDGNGSARALAKIVFMDTGCGMDEKTRVRCLEPFFSTKARGRGTGLGLSSAYGIVKQSGGDILVESEEGRGTRITIALPMLENVSQLTGQQSDDSSKQERPEKILVVEDESGIRNLIQSCLRSRGYDVLTAEDGTQGIRCLEEQGDGVKLVITDMLMPRMDGIQFARTVTRDRQDLKFLIVSGYLDALDTDQLNQFGEAQFLAKPFSTKVLMQKVESMLEPKTGKQA